MAARRRVLLVRHAQTDLNVARIVQGPRLDAHLSVVGRSQARALGQALAKTDLASIYSSPMVRARDTAEAVAGIHAIRVDISPGLVEFDWGVYCGQAETGETARAMAAVFERWWAGDVGAKPPDGESALEASRRVLVAFHAAVEATRATDPRPILLVSHGRILKILLASLLDRDLTKQERYPQHNTGITTLEGEGDRWDLISLNDTSHRVGVDLAKAGSADERNA